MPDDNDEATATALLNWGVNVIVSSGDDWRVIVLAKTADFAAEGLNTVLDSM